MSIHLNYLGRKNSASFIKTHNCIGMLVTIPIYLVTETTIDVLHVTYIKVVKFFRLIYCLKIYKFK